MEFCLYIEDLLSVDFVLCSWTEVAASYTIQHSIKSALAIAIAVFEYTIAIWGLTAMRC